MNSQYRQSQNHGHGQGQKKKKDDSDEFMRLSDREIAGCISDIGVPFSPEDLLRPQPSQIQQVFMWFADLLMNTSVETVRPAMDAAAKDVCGSELDDLIPAETRNLMGFYMSLRKLMLQCGIHDFAFSDLTRPTHPRLVKIFSYIINFVRFREAQTSTIDEHFNKLENTKNRIDSLFLENQELDSRLSTLQSEQSSLVAQAKQKNAKTEELKSKLFALRKDQERLQAEMERTRASKQDNIALLEEKTERTVTQRQEAAKLRPYASQSTPALQSQLNELGETLTRERVQTEQVEKRVRALQTSSDTFSLATNDINPIISSLNSLAADLSAEDQEAQAAAGRRDALAQRSNTVRDIERTENMLQKSIARWSERMDGLRDSAKGREDAALKKQEELRAVHRDLVGERAGKSKEVERRRVRIEQTEKKMADLRENIETEVYKSKQEFFKMNAHINLYITEMEQMV